MRLLTLLTGIATSRLTGLLSLANFRFAKMLRQAAVSVALLLGSVMGWVLGGIFLLLSLFFSFTDMNQLVTPALWTSFVGFAIAIILTFSSVVVMRRPW